MYVPCFSKAITSYPLSVQISTALTRRCGIIWITCSPFSSVFSTSIVMDQVRCVDDNFRGDGFVVIVSHHLLFLRSSSRATPPTPAAAPARPASMALLNTSSAPSFLDCSLSLLQIVSNGLLRYFELLSTSAWLQPNARSFNRFATCSVLAPWV